MDKRVQACEGIEIPEVTQTVNFPAGNNVPDLSREVKELQMGQKEIHEQLNDKVHI